MILAAVFGRGWWRTEPAWEVVVGTSAYSDGREGDADGESRRKAGGGVSFADEHAA